VSEDKKEKRKTRQAAKILFASIEEKGPLALGKRSPFTRKEKGGQ